MGDVGSITISFVILVFRIFRMSATLSFVKSLLNDGLGDREIFKLCNEFLRKSDKKALKFSEVKVLIQKVLEEEESEEETPKMEVCEESEVESDVEEDEDSEYVPSDDEEEDDEDSEYVPSEDEEDEDEDEDEDKTDNSEEEYEEDEDSPDHVTPIKIYLDKPDCSDYDKIVVQPLVDHTFSVTLKHDLNDEEPKSNPDTNMFCANDNEVDDHLRLIMKLIAMDAKPYTQIEFSVPFYPTISVTPKMLKKKANRLLIRNMIQTYLNHYVE